MTSEKGAAEKGAWSDCSKNEIGVVATDPMEGIRIDQCINEQQRNPPKNAENTLELTTETGWSELTQNEVETAVLNEHVVIDNEDGLPPQIDCAVIFVLIGPILISLADPNLIV